MNLRFKDCNWLQWKLLSTETAHSFHRVEREIMQQTKWWPSIFWSSQSPVIVGESFCRVLEECEDWLWRRVERGRLEVMRRLAFAGGKGHHGSHARFFHWPSCQLHGGSSLRRATKLLIFFLSFSHLGAIHHFPASIATDWVAGIQLVFFLCCSSFAPHIVNLRKWWLGADWLRSHQKGCSWVNYSIYSHYCFQKGIIDDSHVVWVLLLQYRFPFHLFWMKWT